MTIRNGLASLTSRTSAASSTRWARASPASGPRLGIEGVKALGGADFSIGPDYMEIGSFIGSPRSPAASSR